VLFLQCIKPGSIWKTTAFVRQVRAAADCVALGVNITDDPKSEEVNNTVLPVSRADIVNEWATDWS
jgi:hypothetical protein